MGLPSLVVEEPMQPTFAEVADRDDLGAFTRKVWKQMDIPYPERFGDRLATASLGDSSRKFRVGILRDKGKIVAAMGSIPVQTDKGLGWDIILVSVDQDREDKIELLDRLSYFCGLKAISEKRLVILSTDAAKEYVYGRDTLGMEATAVGVDSDHKPMRLSLEGDVRDIIKGILKRHPEWALLQ